MELDEETKTQLDGVMGNEAISAYLTQSVENREQAVRDSAKAEYDKIKTRLDEFRETNISQQKELEQYKAVDLDEYGRLKALGSDAASAAEKIKNNDIEWQAKLDGAIRKNEDYEQTINKIESQREKDATRFEVYNAIGRWNSKNPQLEVEAGADRVIIEEALSNYKLLDGKIVMQKEGNDFTTDNGFGTLDEWIGQVALKSMPFCFKKIQGSGASGSSGGGVTKAFKDMTEQDRVKLLKEDPALYRKLRDKE